MAVTLKLLTKTHADAAAVSGEILEVVAGHEDEGERDG